MGLKQKKPVFRRAFFSVAEAGLEPTTFGLCVPTTAFAASSKILEFVVWTFSSSFPLREMGCPPLSLYT
ncbi:MAG: hypothetical protein ACI8X3_003105, partial [Saprospiraceae bacterium]